MKSILLSPIRLPKATWSCVNSCVTLKVTWLNLSAFAMPSVSIVAITRFISLYSRPELELGDEVITVGHTFVATVSAIVHTGATPVLVDVRDDYNMAPHKFEAAVSPRTKAVIPVHLNGRVCDMDAIIAVAKKHGLAVIEDAAQALGASFRGKRAGSFGLAGCFSFYPFKSLGGLGDGGAVTTNDPEIARFATLMRFNGEDRQTGEFHYHGCTALLDNVQAAVLDAKLRHLPDWIEHRRQTASLYRKGLEGIEGLCLPHFPGDEYFDSYQNYVIRTSIATNSADTCKNRESRR